MERTVVRVANAVEDRLLANRVVDRQSQRALLSSDHQRRAGPPVEQAQHQQIGAIDHAPLPRNLCSPGRLIVRRAHAGQYTAASRPRAAACSGSYNHGPMEQVGATEHRPLPQRWVAECAAWRGMPLRFQLESAAPGHGLGRHTIMGVDPFAVLEARGRDTRFHLGGRTQSFDADPFEVLGSLLAEWRYERGRAALPPLAVGYFGYELGGFIERLPQRARADQDFPDLLLGFYDRFLLFDHLTGEVETIDHRLGFGSALPGERYRELFRTPPRAVGPNFTRDQYLAAIGRAQEAIAAGDIYQVNLSQRFAANWSGDPYALYRKLTTVSPAAYSAFLELGNRAVLSASPELFLRVEGDRVITRPIKGTRPRGATEAEDQQLAAELLASNKDRAELTMIVDLERNDLGRVCRPGSVVVSEPQILERHPQVWHLVAAVEGRLAAGIGPVELLRATFPGGSVTGAPKIRAMQIIDELEPTARAVYTGAIGMIGLDGTLTLSVAIRTMLLHGTQVTFQAGGAITADSVPAEEYEETLTKARGMARSIDSPLL